MNAYVLIERPGKFGTIRTYRMDPPYLGHEFILSSSVDEEGGEDTALFPCDETGNVTKWVALDGSIEGTTQHDDVLDKIGYKAVWGDLAAVAP